MSMQYDENPLLFLNSSSSTVPSGRNARAQSRTHQAKLYAPSNKQDGTFTVLQLNPKRPRKSQGGETGSKRRKPAIEPVRYADDGTTHQLSQVATSSNLSRMFPSSGDTPLNAPEILAVATFHIRRIAAMTVRTHPDRLTEVIRCRQWSCVSFALDRFGKSHCLDTALFCVAVKLRQMTGCKVQPSMVLSSYSSALHSLQLALQDPTKYNHMDVLTTTQLLAVYEMLESVDNPAWTTHIAGAASLSQPQVVARSAAQYWNPVTFAQIAPLFTDALLNGDEELFEQYPWQNLLQTLLDVDSPFSRQCGALMSCLLKLPGLLAEARVVTLGSRVSDFAATYNLLDRAHELKSRLRTGLLGSELLTYIDKDSVGSFDKLGMCLAGLVALDRLIASLQPFEKQAQRYLDDKTNELCAQLLQLELGAADGYPATDLMSAFEMSTFQEQAGFIIVLPGRGGD